MRKERRMNKVISKIMCAALAVSIAVTVPTGGAAKVKAAGNETEVVTFGNYWQEDTNGDGVADKNDSKTPIRWQVIKKNADGTAVVISESILDCKYDFIKLYPDRNKKWETSDLRSWLNGEFYNDAFDSSEKGAVISTKNKNQAFVSQYVKKKGNKLVIKDQAETTDSVYLLAWDDVFVTYNGKTLKSGIEGIFSTDYTSYAKANSSTSYYSNKWVLRNPGTQGYVCPSKSGKGEYLLDITGAGVDMYHFDGIRPVITVKLSATKSAAYTWKSDAYGWWVEDSSGWCPKNQWQKVDGKWYYFTADGYMDYSEYRDGYWLNADGTIDGSYTGGHWCSDSYGWWYEDNGWYPCNQYLWIDGVQYWFGADGYWG